MNITSALLAVQDLQTLTARINRTALDDLLTHQAIAASAMDQLLRDRAIVTSMLAEHAQTWRSAVELVATCRPLYVELAAMPEPSLLERHMPEAFCLPTVSPRRFEQDFEDEPNRRTGARKEVTTKIGFIR